MIEYELKFKIDEIPSILENYKFSSKEQNDYYYDTTDYSLISKGNFLRVRGNQIDFKLNSGDITHLYCKELNYNLEEINSNNSSFCEVLTTIGIKCNKEFNSFEEFLENYNFILLCPIKKYRKRYKFNDKLSITIDEVEDLGLYLEAEMMVTEIININKEEIKNEMLSSLNKLQILNGNEQMVMIGYVELYLKKHNKYAYDLGLYKE